MWIKTLTTLLLHQSLHSLQVSFHYLLSWYATILCRLVGLVYTYLAGHVGRDGNEGTFRALIRGYTHWASGRMEELQVITNNPDFCHVHEAIHEGRYIPCVPSPGTRRESCQNLFSYMSVCSWVFVLDSFHLPVSWMFTVLNVLSDSRKSASCTHVSAVLHALSALTPTSFVANK